MIRNDDYFYVVSHFCSIAFSVVGNILLDKGAGEIGRHLMIFTGAPFWTEELFFNLRRHSFELPVQTKSTSSGLGWLGWSFPKRKMDFAQFRAKREKSLSVNIDYLLVFYFYWDVRLASGPKGVKRDYYYYYSDNFFFGCAWEVIFTGVRHFGRIEASSLDQKPGPPGPGPDAMGEACMVIWRPSIRQALAQKSNKC